MKKYLLLLIPFLFFTGHAFAACGSGYTYCRTVTAAHGKAGSSDTSNFAMIISEQDSWLATSANGGKVQNTTTQTGGGASITVPADVIFTSDSACSTKLPFEYETYNSTNGLVNIWVNIGTLSHTADTVIYECYDNSSVTTWQGNVTGTWDSSYAGVWHLANGTTLNANDSTSNAVNGTVNGVAAGTGKIDGDANNTSLANNISFTSPTYTYPMSESFWMYSTDQTDGAQYILTDASGNGGVEYYGAIGHIYIFDGGGTLLADFAITSNQWTYITVTMNSSKNWVAYANGVVKYSGTGTVYGLLRNIAYFFHNATYNGMEGGLDEVRISSTARSADQILAEYNNQSATSTFYTVGTEQGGGGGGGGTFSGWLYELFFGNW